MKLITRILSFLLFCMSLIGTSGCVGTIIETATDAAVAVVKIPVKVGSAVIDVVTDDDEEDE